MNKIRRNPSDYDYDVWGETYCKRPSLPTFAQQVKQLEMEIVAYRYRIDNPEYEQQKLTAINRVQRLMIELEILKRSQPELPPAAPIALKVPKPKVKRQGYLHLRDLLSKNGVVALAYEDTLVPHMKRLVKFGYAKPSQGKTNIWRATEKGKPKFSIEQKVFMLNPAKQQYTLVQFVVTDIKQRASGTWYEVKHPVLNQPNHRKSSSLEAVA
jgi:hypothetical protein